MYGLEKLYSEEMALAYARDFGIKVGVVRGCRGQLCLFRLSFSAFFDLKDGHITRITTFYNLADWIRQVSH